MGGNNLISFTQNDPINISDLLGLFVGAPPIVPPPTIVNNPVLNALARQLASEGAARLALEAGAQRAVQRGTVTIFAASLAALGVMSWKLGVESVELEQALENMTLTELEELALRAKILEKQYEMQRTDERWKCCKPCFPVRTNGVYEIARPGSRIHGAHSRPPFNDGHVKYWLVNQIPYKKGDPESCRCFWSGAKTIGHTQTPPAFVSFKIGTIIPKPTEPDRHPPLGGGNAL